MAQQSPSPLWTDFLDRMAFSLAKQGQPIDAFMRAEQETVAEQYNTLYDTRLESVDTLKEIYVSLVSAESFWTCSCWNTFGSIRDRKWKQCYSN